MKNVSKNQDEQKQKSFGKEDLIGSVFGIYLAWATGFGGFVPYLISIPIGIWFTNEAFKTDNYYYWIGYWVVFVILFLGSLIRGMYMSNLTN